MALCLKPLDVLHVVWRSRREPAGLKVWQLVRSQDSKRQCWGKELDSLSVGHHVTFHAYTVLNLKHSGQPSRGPCADPPPVGKMVWNSETLQEATAVVLD
jgi:hypothetical protein